MMNTLPLALTALIATCPVENAPAFSLLQSEPVPQVLRDLERLMDSPPFGKSLPFVRSHFSAGAREKESAEDFASEISLIWDHTRGLEHVGWRHIKDKSWQLTGVATLGKQPIEFTVDVAGDGIDRLDWSWQQDSTSGRLTRAQGLRELRSYLRDLASADVLSGTVLVAHGDRIEHLASYGQANRDFRVPMRPQYKMNLASMNKMFTAVAVAQLVQAGKLSFDDPVSKYLDFPTKEDATRITIKQLLTHTSGLGSYSVKESRHGVTDVQGFLGLAASDRPKFEPGTDQAYSNTGYVVLGAVIEKVSGMSYYDYVKRNIYDPIGMMSTDAYNLDLVNPGLAVGYEKIYTPDGFHLQNNICEVGFGGPAGGGYSTAQDLFRFATALRAGKLLRPDFVTLLTTPKPEFNSPTYGYGFSVYRGVVGHSGGDTGVNTTFEMKGSETLIVLCNYGGVSRRIAAKIKDLWRRMERS